MTEKERKIRSIRYISDVRMLIMILDFESHSITYQVFGNLFNIMNRRTRKVIIVVVSI